MARVAPVAARMVPPAFWTGRSMYSTFAPVRVSVPPDSTTSAPTSVPLMAKSWKSPVLVASIVPQLPHILALLQERLSLSQYFSG